MFRRLERVLSCSHKSCLGGFEFERIICRTKRTRRQPDSVGRAQTCHSARLMDDRDPYGFSAHDSAMTA
ncbi:hypothetical protein ACOMHN_053521 [Nucella lapillus]